MQAYLVCCWTCINHHYHILQGQGDDYVLVGTTTAFHFITTNIAALQTRKCVLRARRTSLYLVVLAAAVLLHEQLGQRGRDFALAVAVRPRGQ